MWNFHHVGCCGISGSNFQGQCRISGAIALSYPPIVIDDSSWKNVAEWKLYRSANPNPRGGGGTRECNSTKFPVQGWQAWWKPVSSRIFMLRVKQQISFHQLFDIGKDINFSNCYGLEMTLLAKKHHTVQKNIHNSAKTFDILLK